MLKNSLDSSQFLVERLKRVYSLKQYVTTSNNKIRNNLMKYSWQSNLSFPYRFCKLSYTLGQQDVFLNKDPGIFK